MATEEKSLKDRLHWLKGALNSLHRRQRGKQNGLHQDVIWHGMYNTRYETREESNCQSVVLTGGKMNPIYLKKKRIL